jgi:hypothetical protein
MRYTDTHSFPDSLVWAYAQEILGKESCFSGSRWVMVSAMWNLTDEKENSWQSNNNKPKA